MAGMLVSEKLRLDLDAACRALTEKLVGIFNATLDQIVAETVAQLDPLRVKPQTRPRKARLAVLRPSPHGGFEMALASGGLWHGSRARDLRRKARRMGIAWQEQGI